ncbi:hypothetical protein [Sphingomonas glaciei]|uniref:Uncharacterized protein n=1 Tax=Sphingomonas glaciei TaxID=2938948 RepID=A0ABY5MUH2_9SPHN|nr:hypothetical protein [Sphingomonas glaciei]UUR08140.1 hypothetical protein M1K48_00365 [Sphingomonas glaciei]
MIRILIFQVIFLTCVWYAWKAGGQPERAAMLAQAVAYSITLSTGYLRVAGGFTNIVEGWLIADILLLAALIWLALQANRLWTLLLAGLHLAAIFVHLAKATYPQFPPFGYALFLQFWAYPMLLTTAIGIRRHQIRLRRYGPYPDWKRPRKDQPAA